MSRMRRALAAALAAVFLGTLGAPITCAGWENSAAGRMACCRHAHPETSSDQTVADACCAQHEQSRQPASGLATLILQPPATVAIVFVDPSIPSALQLSRVWYAGVHTPHGPPGLFSPPLRV